MKASIKFREDEQKPPLLRAKVPVSIFNLSFTTSISASGAGDSSSDLSLSLLTSFPSFPSLVLSYRPNPNFLNPNPSPFSLTLKSGLGPLGSPSASPLSISLRLSSSNPNPTFFISLKPRLGHFSFSKSLSSFSSNPNPNPKENGGGVHHPIPIAPPPPLTGAGLDEFVRGGIGLKVWTAVPVGPRAGLKVRWAVRLPEAAGPPPRAWGRLPYLSLDKISLERVEVREEAAAKGEVKEWGEKDLVAMRGMCFWMEREAEELRKENRSIKEGIEAVKLKFEKEGRSNAGSVGWNAVVGKRA